jgi:hypothetical protein
MQNRCVDPATNAFPSLRATGDVCPGRSCIQGVTAVPSLLDFVIDTAQISFTRNTTFAVLSDPTDAFVNSCSFVNTGGLAYACGKTRFNRTIGTGTFFFSTFYFYQVSTNIPNYYPCSRTDCQQIQVNSTYVFNTCDGVVPNFSRLKQKRTFFFFVLLC